MSELKLCKNCKHFRPRDVWNDGPTCNKALYKICLVYGHKYYMSCEDVRSERSPCGEKGHWYEDIRPISNLVIA